MCIVNIILCFFMIIKNYFGIINMKLRGYMIKVRRKYQCWDWEKI